MVCEPMKYCIIFLIYAIKFEQISCILPEEKQKCLYIQSSIKTKKVEKYLKTRLQSRI